MKLPQLLLEKDTTSEVVPRSILSKLETNMKLFVNGRRGNLEVGLQQSRSPSGTFSCSQCNVRSEMDFDNHAKDEQIRRSVTISASGALIIEVCTYQDGSEHESPKF